MSSVSHFHWYIRRKCDMGVFHLHCRGTEVVIGAGGYPEDLILPVRFGVAKGCCLLAVFTERIDHIISKVGASITSTAPVRCSLKNCRYRIISFFQRVLFCGNDDYSIGSA